MNIIFGGPSGSGKTTLSNYFVDNEENYKFFLSVTSRLKREGEIAGREYDFYSKEEFLYKVSEGIIKDVVEYGNTLYGYYTKAEEAISDENLIFIVVAKRALEIKAANPKFCLIFLIPPTADEYFIRKGNRGNNRVKDDLEMLKLASEFDYIIINDNISKTISDIKTVVDAFEQNSFCGFEKEEMLPFIEKLHNDINVRQRKK